MPPYVYTSQPASEPSVTAPAQKPHRPDTARDDAICTTWRSMQLARSDGASATLPPSCRTSSVLLIVAFSIAIAVTVAMLLQISFGSVPRLYPILALGFPLMLLLHNMDVIRTMADLFLPGAVNKALYITILVVQVVTIILVSLLDFGEHPHAELRILPDVGLYLDRSVFAEIFGWLDQR